MNFTQNKKHFKLIFFVSIIILFLIIIIATTLGSADIPLKESLCIILNKIPVVNRFTSTVGISSNHSLIILKIRLPRIILSALIGMGLSTVGLSFQAIFKNPMADPYVLGISSGAAVGAALGFVLGFENSFLGASAITLIAFLGSMLTTVLVYNIARVKNKIPTNILLLSGISVSFLLSSLLSIIMVFNRQEVEKIVFWTMGSVSSASYNQILVLLPFLLIGILIIFSFSRDLNIILTGDETAKSLGINVEIIKKILLIVSSMIVAACVSVSGIIGFVGLIIPQIVRILLGPDHRIVLPFSVISGAAFMVISDTLARTLASPAEIPVGAITSLFGAPYFIYLLIKHKKKVL